MMVQRVRHHGRRKVSAKDLCFRAQFGPINGLPPVLLLGPRHRATNALSCRIRFYPWVQSSIVIPLPPAPRFFRTASTPKLNPDVHPPPRPPARPCALAALYTERGHACTPAEMSKRLARVINDPAHAVIVAETAEKKSSQPSMSRSTAFYLPHFRMGRSCPDPRRDRRDVAPTPPSRPRPHGTRRTVGPRARWHDGVPPPPTPCAPTPPIFTAVLATSTTARSSFLPRNSPADPHPQGSPFCHHGHDGPAPVRNFFSRPAPLVGWLDRPCTALVP